MSADDNLLAIITGGLEGFASTYVPFKKAEYEDALLRRRKQEDTDNELKLYQAKLPIQMQSDLLRKKMELSLEEGMQGRLLDRKAGYAKELAGMKAALAAKNAAGGGAGKPLTVEGKKLAGNLEDGVKSVDTALEILTRRPNIYIKTGLDIPLLGDFPSRVASIGDEDAQIYRREVTNASDILARYRTGAAINNTELRTYKGMLSDALASPKVAKQNLAKVRDFFQKVNADLKAGTRSYSEPAETLAEPVVPGIGVSPAIPENEDDPLSLGGF